MEKEIKTIGFFTNGIINYNNLFNTKSTKLTIERESNYYTILKNIYNFHKEITLKKLILDKAIILINNNIELLKDELTYLSLINTKEIIILIENKELTLEILKLIKKTTIPIKIYTINNNTINLESIIELIDEKKETKTLKL